MVSQKEQISVLVLLDRLFLINKSRVRILLGARTVTTIPLQFLALHFAEAIPTATEVYHENCDTVRAAGVARGTGLPSRPGPRS